MKVGMAKTDQERRSDKIREHTHTEQIPKPWTWTSPKKSGGFSLGWPRPDGSLRTGIYTKIKFRTTVLLHNSLLAHCGAYFLSYFHLAQTHSVEHSLCLELL